MKPTPSVSEALQSRLTANDRAQERKEELYARLTRMQQVLDATVAALQVQTAELAAQRVRDVAEQEAELDRVFGVAN